MTDFIQRQYEISNELIRLMYKDADERARILEHVDALLAEKDKQIAKLESTIEAMRVMQGTP